MVARSGRCDCIPAHGGLLSLCAHSCPPVHRAVKGAGASRLSGYINHFPAALCHCDLRWRALKWPNNVANLSQLHLCLFLHTKDSFVPGLCSQPHSGMWHSPLIFFFLKKARPAQHVCAHPFNVSDPIGKRWKMWLFVGFSQNEELVLLQTPNHLRSLRANMVLYAPGFYCIHKAQ